MKFLGTPQVTVEGREVAVDTRKATALLSYLAVHGAAERDVIANLFWADTAPDRARATLRRTLSALRTGVGTNYIRSDRNRIELTGEHHSDLEKFQSLVASTAEHGHDPADVCTRCIAPLSEAVQLYRGHFLGAFSVRDAPEFEDWARSVTESLRLEMGSVLRRLAIAQASNGEYVAARASTARWIELDELHEPAHRQMMLLNAWAGDRPAAIQAYRDCVGVLDRELGVSPLEETTELYEAILDEDLPPAPGARRPVRSVRSSGPSVPPEIIDRRQSIRALERVLAGVGESRLVCVLTGDSWMGKTRLVEFLSERARTEGMNLAAGVGLRAETNLPFGLVTQLLEPLVSEVDHANLPGWVDEELSRLNPRLARGSGAPPTGQLGQLRLYEAFLTLVEAAAADRPLVLTIDDAQWIDAASADMIAFVVRRSVEAALLVVISTRRVESLKPALRELALDADHTIELASITASDLDDLPAGPDVDSILSATGGIPLLVQQALESGEVRPDSTTVTKYMDSRRRRLSDLGEQLMTAAAVLGGLCDPTLLRETSGRTEEEVVEAVEELVSSGLLREFEDGRLGFTFDLLGAATYESMSLIRRRLLHGRAADALASHSRTAVDARLATATAEHLEAAGRDEAPTWFVRAGELARAVYANDEAAEAYEKALALGHPEVGQARLALGELAMVKGDYERAATEFTAAAAQSSGPTLALVEHRIGDLNRLLGRFELAEESFMRAEQEHPNPAALYADWALLEHRTGDTERAMTLAGQAVGAAEEAKDTALRARALNILGVVTPDMKESMRHLDVALGLAGNRDTARMAVLNNKAHLLALDENYDDAMILVEEAIGIAERAGYRHHQAALANHLADLLHKSGRSRDAETKLTEAVTLFSDIVTIDWEPEVWLLRQW